MPRTGDTGVKMMDSNAARNSWREVLDAALSGADTVIERYGRPAAAVIPYDDFEALQEQLAELRAIRRAQAAYEEWRRDPASGKPLAEVEEELRVEGLLRD